MDTMVPRDIHATPKSSKAVPTNVVTYKGRKIPARIDPNARLAYVVEIMAQSFDTAEHHITLCLRDEADHLITQSKLPSKVAKGENIKLAPSPTTEALSVISSFKTYLAQPTHRRLPSADQSSLNLNTDGHLRDGISLKLALFNLQKYIKEEDFVVDFMVKGGDKMLFKLMEAESGLSGNTLAYALQGIRGLLEFEAGWTEIQPSLIDRILLILSSSAQPNVLRPATAIIRKFVISSPHLQAGVPADAYRTPVAAGRRGPSVKGKERADMPIPAGPDKRFGFDAIWRRMESVGAGLPGEGNELERIWTIIVKRIEGTGDLELVALTLGLINACLRSADSHNSPSYSSLISLLEHLSVRKYVSRLMVTSATNAIEPQILNFQSRWTAILHRKRLTPVRPTRSPNHEKMLSEIWVSAGLGRQDLRASKEEVSATSGRRDLAGWSKLGLGIEEGGMGIEGDGGLFRDVGELGLECLHWYAMHEENIANIVLEQQAKPAERRCPLGQASIECVKILCEHYKVSQAGHVHPTHFQLFLLHFPRLYHIAQSFFLRMWHESESRLSDFSRLSNLVRSQLLFSLSSESQATWLSLEQDLLESDYAAIRERQMEMLEREDGMMVNPGVRELREVVGREAYEVVIDQRIGCMLQGAWFNAATLVVSGIHATVKPNTARPLRFVRLSPNRKSIAWGDYAARPSSNPTYDLLRERLDISNITSVQPLTSTAVNSRSQGTASKISFSLLSGPELSLLDLDAVHSAQMAEWVDGVRVLKGEGGMRSADSLGYVKVLTEIALKVRLLDITGDGVELPEKIVWGQAPRSVDFWYAK